MSAAEELEAVVDKPYRPLVKGGAVAMSIIIGLVSITLYGSSRATAFVEEHARTTLGPEMKQAASEHSAFTSRLDSHDVAIEQMRQAAQEQRELLIRIDQTTKDIREARRGR